MSQENVEVVQALFAAWNAGDMQAVRELYDPDVVVRAPTDWPEPGPWFGRDAVMQQWALQRTAFDADVLEAVGDWIDAADRVVARFVWRGAGQGPEANLELTGVSALRNGKIVSQEFFWDHAEVLEAMGLSRTKRPG